jgi:hypothetical protein
MSHNHANEFDTDHTVITSNPLEMLAELPAFPPQAPQVPAAPRGRPQCTDPTDPAQIVAIARRAKSHYFWTGTCFLHGWTKKGALEYAKHLKSLGLPVNARMDGDALVFWV